MLQEKFDNEGKRIMERTNNLMIENERMQINITGHQMELLEFQKKNMALINRGIFINNQFVPPIPNP